MYAIKSKKDDSKSSEDLKEPEPINEIEGFLEARYLSVSEAVYRILSLDLQFGIPTVERLDVHLPNKQPVTYKENASTDELHDVLKNVSRTRLTEWFAINAKELQEPLPVPTITGADGELQPRACELFYDDFPRYYSWNKSTKRWSRRVKRQDKIGRPYYANPAEGERYYLRRLLFYVKGPTCFEDVRTYEGTVHETFKAACKARGLLDDDAEWDECLNEAALAQTGSKLRGLFVIILTHCEPTDPVARWERHRDNLCPDFLLRHRKERQDFSLPLNEDVINAALIHIHERLAFYGDEHYGLPTPDRLSAERCFMGKEILEALEYDKKELDGFAEKRLSQMTDEQRQVFDSVMTAVHTERPAKSVFFVDAPGGTGKTFVFNTILASTRAKGKTALAVASSGIASLLLQSGRTAHSRFKIPIRIFDDSVCYISKNCDLANLFRRSDVVVWDEAPMQHRHVLDAVDRTLRDLRSTEKPFGGIPFVMSGDFRQILPVVRKGGRADIVNACVKSSPLWKSIEVLRLTIDMRVLKRRAANASAEEIKKLDDFSKFLQNVGDGKLKTFPELGQDVVQLPEPIVSQSSTIGKFIDEIYPELETKCSDVDYICSRAILAPLNSDVDAINDLAMSKFPGRDTRTFLSADTLGDADDPNLYPPEFLNTLNPSDLPPHKLQLKEGAPIILLRNLDAKNGHATELK